MAQQTKYGYQLHKGREVFEKWGNHAVLGLTIFHMSFGRWERLIDIEWKDFPDVRSSGAKWMWSNIQLSYSLGSNDFSKALSLMTRMSNDNTFNEDEPIVFLNWLKGRRNMTQVEWDGRISRFRTVAQVEAEADMDVYGFYSSPNSLKDYIYAKCAETAVHVVEAKIEASEPYYSQRLLENKQMWYFAKVLTGDAPTIMAEDDWLYNPYA